MNAARVVEVLDGRAGGELVEPLARAERLGQFDVIVSVREGARAVGGGFDLPIEHVVSDRRFVGGRERAPIEVEIETLGRRSRDGGHLDGFPPLGVSLVVGDEVVDQRRPSARELRFEVLSFDLALLRLTDELVFGRFSSPHANGLDGIVAAT